VCAACYPASSRGCGSHFEGVGKKLFVVMRPERRVSKPKALDPLAIRQRALAIRWDPRAGVEERMDPGNG